MEANETEDKTLEILHQVVEHSEAFWIPAGQENNILNHDQLFTPAKCKTLHFHKTRTFQIGTVGQKKSI